MRDDPADIWTTEHASDYQNANYGSGLAGHVLHRSHSLLEEPFDSTMQFSKVLEVGCGSGYHARFVRHKFDSYLMTDASEEMLSLARSANTDNRFSFSQTKAETLPFPDASFDRLIACHVLEHIYRPHETLREWNRVLGPSGVLSLVLPCDPGIAWRLGRYFGPRQSARKRGLPYDYVMAREHVNPINNLVYLLRYYFDDYTEKWWPLRLPSMDLNLIYTVNIRKRTI